MRDVEHLEFAVFVASGEDKIAVVVPHQSVAAYILWLGIDHRVVPSLVLQYDGTYLRGMVGDAQSPIVHTHAHLLMAVVDVDVGVTGDAEAHFHAWFHNHETRREHGLAVVVLVVHRDAVIAAEPWRALVVGQREGIVGVERVGVDGLFGIVDGVACGKAVDEVALKELLRRGPVSLAVLYLVAIAMDDV